MMLAIRNLGVRFHTRRGVVPAVEDVSLSLEAGEVLALVGESGSGKSVTGLSVMSLLPDRRVEVTGSIRFEDTELLGAPPRELRRLRGGRIAMIFQEPMTSLNPVLTVGDQIAETLVLHQRLGRGAAWHAAVALLERVGIPDAARRARQYAHQLSGGMRQRVMIAIAVSCRPRLLIADEPTTALDVTIQAQILDLLRALRAELGMAMLFITHDLGVVGELADRVAVMYAGRIVESGPTAAVLRAPLMPYTRGLLASLPRPSAPARLQPIPGNVADPLNPPPGCRFAPRCAEHRPRCDAAEPVLEDATAERRVRCVRWAELAAAPVYAASGAPLAADAAPQPAPWLLEVDRLVKHFPLGVWRAGARQVVRAVDDVSFRIARGEVVGLVGESGSGKTTVGRCVLRLIEPTSGSVRFDGVELTRLGRRELNKLRRAMQIVFQDPFASLNPKLSVGTIIGEAAGVHGIARGQALERHVAELLELVGLQPGHAKRRPHEFSGGQRQRIAIARALALDPAFVVADEAVSALDVSVRAQIINLLQELRQRLSLTMLFIAHDLGVVRHLCDRVVVLYLGRVMESGPVARVLERPSHPYTQALLSAVPEPDPQTRRQRILLAGDPPSPIAPPSGCVFRTRCPKAVAACAATVPPPVAVAPGHISACLFNA